MLTVNQTIKVMKLEQSLKDVRNGKFKNKRKGKSAIIPPLNCVEDWKIVKPKTKKTNKIK